MKFKREKGKICATCKRILPLSAFYRSGFSKDGYRSYCEECYNTEVAKFAKLVRKETAEKLRKETEDLMKERFPTAWKYKEYFEQQEI